MIDSTYNARTSVSVTPMGRRQLLLAGAATCAGAIVALEARPAYAEGPDSVVLAGLEGVSTLVDTSGVRHDEPSYFGCTIQPKGASLQRGCIVSASWDDRVYSQDTVSLVGIDGVAVPLTESTVVEESSSTRSLTLAIEQDLASDGVYTLLLGSTVSSIGIDAYTRDGAPFEIKFEGNAIDAVAYSPSDVGMSADADEGFWSVSASVLWVKNEWQDGQRWVWEPRSVIVVCDVEAAPVPELNVRVALDERYGSGAAGESHSFVVPVLNAAPGEPLEVAIDVPTLVLDGDIEEFMPAVVEVGGVSSSVPQVASGLESYSGAENAYDSESFAALTLTE